MSDGRDADLLIHRHLEGTLEEGDAEALAELVRRDPAVARRLAEASYDAAVMKDVLADAPEESSGEAAPHAGDPWPKAPLAAAAAILLAVGAAVLAWSLREPVTVPEPGSTPAVQPDAPLVRFHGVVSGEVLIVREGGRVGLRIVSVDRVFEAEGDADRLVDREILLTVKQGDGVRDRTRFLERMRRGTKEEALEIEGGPEDGFVLVRLSESQRARVRRDPPREGGDRPGDRGEEEKPRRDRDGDREREGDGNRSPERERGSRDGDGAGDEE